MPINIYLAMYLREDWEFTAAMEAVYALKY
jgi:hypothetical protein